MTMPSDKCSKSGLQNQEEPDCDSSGASYLRSDPNSTSNLQGFILSQYSKQNDNQGLHEVDERTTNFFERALGETQRMNREVERSKNKRDKLYVELGNEQFKQWQKEHSAEVLNTEVLQTKPN